jgi:16S rRNA (guanine527-N7)-methyltransferase
LSPHWRIPEWFPELSEEIQGRLKLFHVELIKFNKAINLISPSTVESADLIHFSDSIKAQYALNLPIESTSVSDLGSGSGFPAIIFAILDSQREWIAIDVDQRKAEFLKHCQRKIQLPNFTAENHDLAKSRLQIQSATCRAFAPMRELIGKYGHNIKPGGTLYALKGPNWETELHLLEKSKLSSTWNILLHSEYSLPVTADRRYLIKIQKSSNS